MILDPQMYGDQENRVSTVDSLRESVRRAILLRPVLAPAFYILALMDGLSYDAKTKEGGRMVRLYGVYFRVMAILYSLET